MFGAQSSTPAFGSPFSSPAFGTPSSSPAFGTPSSSPAFGAFSSPTFGTPSAPAFGAPSSSPSFGTPAFGTPSTSLFGTPSFGTASTSAFGSSLFSSPFTSQPQQTPLFQQQPTGYVSQNVFPATAPSMQLSTQMAPLAPVAYSLANRDIQAIIDAYKDDPGNPKYVFRHLLFSVTEPQFRVKPAAVSDIMWGEAMEKLEGMDSVNRGRLWPQLVQGFKDLSHRLKVQDEVIVSDSERLKKTQSNVKMLQGHFQSDTLPRIQRMRQKEQSLQRRLLRLMRVVEALENRTCRLPLTKEEADLAEKLYSIASQIKVSGGELYRRVQTLHNVTRAQADALGGGSAAASMCFPESTKIQAKGYSDMQKVLQHQTEAISRLGNVLKRDIRDFEIILGKEKELKSIQD